MVTVSELIEFMSFILQKNEDGLAILVGAAPAPTALELYEMRCGGQVDYGVRIDGGEGVPHAQSALESVEGIEEIISDAGGWKSYTLRSKSFAKNSPNSTNSSRIIRSSYARAASSGTELAAWARRSAANTRA